MGKLFYLMGKSASGKDSLLADLRAFFGDRLRSVVLYATRPIRTGETDGKSYHFLTNEEFRKKEAAGEVIESRLYHTVYGPWIYATMNDGQIQPDRYSYLMVGTLESFMATRRFFGEDTVVPLYVEVENGERLARALRRERAEEHPRYAELCRRFLADEEDFSEAKLAEAGITRRFVNDDRCRCFRELRDAVEEALR